MSLCINGHTEKRTPPEFFAEHTVTVLLTWSDLDLEGEGRLTEPLKWDAATDWRSRTSTNKTIVRA